jgi:hypothetical protein
VLFVFLALFLAIYPAILAANVGSFWLSGTYGDIFI